MTDKPDADQNQKPDQNKEAAMNDSLTHLSVSVTKERYQVKTVDSQAELDGTAGGGFSP